MTSENQGEKPNEERTRITEDGNNETPRITKNGNNETPRITETGNTETTGTNRQPNHVIERQNDDVAGTKQPKGNANDTGIGETKTEVHKTFWQKLDEFLVDFWK